MRFTSSQAFEGHIYREGEGQDTNNTFPVYKWLRQHGKESVFEVRRVPRVKFDPETGEDIHFTSRGVGVWITPDEDTDSDYKEWHELRHGDVVYLSFNKKYVKVMSKIEFKYNYAIITEEHNASTSN